MACRVWKTPNETRCPGAARLLIENRGGKAITFNPNFALHFKDPNIQVDSIILRASPQKDSRKKNPFSLSAEGGFNIAIPKGEEEGKRAQVKPFLPDPDSYPYINVPPGEVKEVSVVGSNPLPALKRPSLGRRQGARSHCEVTEDAYCRRRSNSMRPV
jgi:hypothetical protein